MRRSKFSGYDRRVLTALAQGIKAMLLIDAKTRTGDSVKYLLSGQILTTVISVQKSILTKLQA